MPERYRWERAAVPLAVPLLVAGTASASFYLPPPPPPHTHHVCTMFVPFGPLHSQVMRRYHIQNRDDYKKYNKICGMITKLTCILKQLDAQDTARIEMTDQLLDK